MEGPTPGSNSGKFIRNLVTGLYLNAEGYGQVHAGRMLFLLFVVPSWRFVDFVFAAKSTNSLWYICKGKYQFFRNVHGSPLSL